ncbi:efflux RND transporter periplasmic adaptor subunit [Orbaceae bacterium ac157xtp]
MKFRKSLTPILISVALSSGFLLAGCDNNSPKQEAGSEIPSVNVKVFKVEPLDFKIQKTLPARVVASQIAEIRPQVGGIILKKEFEESSNVETGQSLYQIDPAIYQANYDSALASVASAKANANIAHLTLKRYEGLLKTKSISQQDYDKAAADAQQADAAVLVAEANLNSAKVNVDYTKVYSPIDGYIGKSNVTQGALVQVGQQEPMAVVQTLDPIYVDMTESAIKYQQDLRNQNNLYTPDVKVEIYFNDGTKFDQEGFIKFSDNSVNETTGTVTLRAQFPNPEHKILPGMFVKPLLTLGTIHNAVVVPQTGITSDVKGDYTAKILKPDNTIEHRTGIKVYAGIPGYWVVTDGINVGEQVIVSGLLNLTAVERGDVMKGNVIADPATLTQAQLNKIVQSNIK